MRSQFSLFIRSSRLLLKKHYNFYSETAIALSMEKNFALQSPVESQFPNAALF